MAGIYILAGVLLTVAVAVIRSWWRDLRKDHGLTKPLGSIAGLYGAALILYVVGAAYSVFHVLGGGRLVLMSGASPQGLHLFWLGAHGFEKSAFFACDAFPDPVVRVRAERILAILLEAYKNESLTWIKL